MKIVIFTIAALLHSGAWAADIDLVRDGCEALLSKQKKAACLAAAVRLSGGNVSARGADKTHAQAKSKILALLNDPESAKFRSTSVSPESGATCGFVSSKNAMGGYGDPFRFIVNEEMARIDSPRSPGFDYRWAELCGDI
ncbi:hypothetical protein [Janthinobacterium sp.]|uniref:hypothetical protein n=1 Tax=Janthinobacterium sp. TaxID=1871054 RepID=UPI0026082624|nr:hypothetical protein [Janthinobacterium sp.]